MPERHHRQPPQPGRLLARLMSWLPDKPRRRWLEPSLCELQAEFLRAHRASGSKPTALASRLRFQLCAFRFLCSCLFWTAADGLHSSLSSIQEKTPMQDFAQDLRHAFRSLLRKPGFSLVCLALLAMGIGASTAIFSVVHTVLLDPLPFPQPDRLFAMIEKDENRQRQGNQLAYQDFEDLRRQSRSFEAMAAVMRGSAILGGQPSRRVNGFFVDAELFKTLGVEPVMGRTFRKEDEKLGQDQVAMLGHHLWAGHFGSDPEMVGRTISLNDREYSVIGVLPPGFRLEMPQSGNDLWLPLGPHHHLARNRAIHTFEVFARLKADVDPSQAEAELQTLASQLEAAYPETNQGRGFGLMPLAEQVSGSVRPALAVAFAAVLLLLLLASVNLANLFLARAAARQREMALRGALGAGRLRLARMLLTESLLVALAGGAAGAALAAGTVHLIPSLLPDSFPRWQEIGLHPQMLAFALGLTLATGVLFSLAPALSAGRTDPAASLKHKDSSLPRRLRSSLVAAQVGLALMLLIGAGLLAGSFYSLMKLDPGFRTDRVLTFNISLPVSGYQTRRQVAGFVEQLSQGLEALPEVEQAATVSSLPLSGHNVGSSLHIEGISRPISQAPSVGWQFVSPGYFETIGIPLLQGRDFQQSDLDSRQHLVIINQSLARSHFPDQNPIGKRIELGLPAGDWHQIIGVVGNVRHRTLETEPTARAYDLLGQHWGRTLTVVLHTKGEAFQAAAPSRALLKEVDDRIPIFALASTAEVRSRSVTTRRLVTLLMTSFAALAVLLAAVGIYGVLSYTVERRSSEIGVRMALGARSRDILKLVVGQGLLLTLSGGMVGLLASLGLSRFLAGLLYGLSPTDPSTILLMALLLTTVALLSCAIPARRASKIDPQSALRTE